MSGGALRSALTLLATSPSTGLTAHPRHAGLDHAERLGRRLRQIDDAVFGERSAVVDADHHRAAIVEILDPDMSAERQRGCAAVSPSASMASPLAVFEVEIVPGGAPGLGRRASSPPVLRLGVDCPASARRDFRRELLRAWIGLARRLLRPVRALARLWRDRGCAGASVCWRAMSIGDIERRHRQTAARAKAATKVAGWTLSGNTPATRRMGISLLTVYLQG